MNPNTLRLMFAASGVFMALLVIQGHAAWIQSVRASSDLDNAKTATLRQQATDIQIAESRFENGCVTIGDDENPYVSITQGMKVHGRGNESNKAPLPDGTVICDRWGGTAVMKDGAATQFASSPKYAQQSTTP
jgi:hypothetical protein